MKKPAKYRRSPLLPLAIGILLLFLMPGMVSCGPQSIHAVDWVDFVQVHGIQYLSQYNTVGVGRDLEQSDLGLAFATVKFKLSGNVNSSDYQIKDGDAGDLDAGNILYTVKGYKPTFRLAAYHSRKIVLYEADYNPKAKRGADLLDIQGKVQSIDIHSWTDPEKKLGAITDAREVANLVAMVLAAPVNQHLFSSGDATYTIIFVLKDGTVVARTYFTSTGELLHHIVLPKAFTMAIEKATSH